jgi:integral membrane protein
MANIVGVLLIVLILVGVPLANFDGTGMWYVIPATPDLWPQGSTAHELGAWITHYLGVAHGWLYMIFLFFAFLLSRRADWTPGFTIVTLLAGTVPVLSFWAEHRATRDVRARIALEEAGAPDGPTGSPAAGTTSDTTSSTTSDTTSTDTAAAERHPGA